MQVASDAKSTVLRIGEFRIESALDEVSRDGTVTKLEPRAMRVLVHLAEHAGQVVSVDQLLDAVWKDVVVTPDSVYQVVAGLRRSLGDDPKSPTYIANVLRRGYRLIAPVTAWTEAAAERPAAAIASRRRAYLSVATAVVGALIAAWYWRSLPKRLAPTPVATAAQQPSVAVLPFLDLSERHDQAYLADGLSEELIDMLTRVPELQVPGRASSFYFKGRSATVNDIGKLLKVRYLLDGSIRKSGSTLRITTQLVRVDTGYQVWSKTYERPLDDVFKIQDEIAASVVRALKGSLLTPLPANASRSSSTEAYELFLRARALERSAGEGDIVLAQNLLARAVALDPKFAAAWADLANALTEDFGWHQQRDERGCQRAREAIGQALRLDPLLVNAHTINSWIVTVCDNDLARAEAEARRAVELGPQDAQAWNHYGVVARQLRHFPDAVRYGQEAVRRDPLQVWNYFQLSWAQGFMGQFADAEASLRRAIEVDPTVAGIHGLHANSLLALRQPAAALKELELEGDDQFRQMTLPLALDALGRHAEAEREMNVFVLKYGNRDPWSVAEFYACRGDFDHALQWLERAGSMHMIDDVPNRIACFAKLQYDPRYAALYRKWGKPV